MKSHDYGPQAEPVLRHEYMLGYAAGYAMACNAGDSSEVKTKTRDLASGWKKTESGRGYMEGVAVGVSQRARIWSELLEKLEEKGDA